MPPAAVLAWLSLAASVLLPLGNSAIAGTPISSARVWPAAEYTTTYAGIRLAHTVLPEHGEKSGPGGG